MMVDLSTASWRKSSWSNANGCVEVAFVEDRVAVRDSKQRGGPVLVFTAQEWAAFLRGVRDGEFERPPSRRRQFRPADGG
jgi:Domain of unknown function (DUF397)